MEKWEVHWKVFKGESRFLWACLTQLTDSSFHRKAPKHSSDSDSVDRKWSPGQHPVMWTDMHLTDQTAAVRCEDDFTVPRVTWRVNQRLKRLEEDFLSRHNLCEPNDVCSLIKPPFILSKGRHSSKITFFCHKLWNEAQTPRIKDPTDTET